MTDFHSMNETDVREIIVRPFLEQLGYRHGTSATIRTELTLRYAHAFLGRKNPKKDPPLAGRADYICEVTSYGRWVVEVKAPHEPIARDVIEQAHTYAAHPEIAATHFMVTNGREFRLYQTARLDDPLISFAFDELQQNVLKVFNIVGPEAVRKRARMNAADVGQPLGAGLCSKLEIIGGEVRYEDHASDSPLFDADTINGLCLPVTGGYVDRADDGRIRAHVKVAKAAAMFRDLSDLFSTDGYDFFAAAEYVSTDAENPIIFQNVIELNTTAGTLITMPPPFGKVPIPFSMKMVSWTEAVGFFEDDVFKGAMRLSYDMTLSGMAPQMRALMESQYGRPIPARSQFTGAGTFQIRVRDAR